MDCTLEQYPDVVGDKDNRLKEALMNTSNNSVRIATIMAGFFVDNKFKAFLKERIGDVSPAEANMNDVKHVVNEWMRMTHPSVAATAAKVENDPLDGFSSSKAKSLAIADIANRILDANIENESKGTKKDAPGRVLATVATGIVNTFTNTYFQSCYNRTGVKDETIDDLTKQIKNLKKQLNTYKTKKKNGEKLTKDEVKQFKSLSEEYKKLIKEITPHLINYVLKHGTIQERNFAIYTHNILTDSKTWLRKGFGLKKLIGLSKKYGYSLTSTDLSEIMDSFDDTIYDEESDGLNEEYRRYLDEQDKYKSFLQLVDDDLRNYISCLANLAEVWDGEKPIIYDTDNELGVATRMNAGFVINNIISRCDFSGGIDGLIASLEKLVSSKRKLFGISVMIDKMKKDHGFARQVFYGLGNPIVGKLMINIENDINIRRSNNEANARLNLLFTLSNRLKGSFNSFYKTNLMEGINAIGPKYSDDMNINLIYRYLNGFFPGIDGNAIEAYVKADKTKVKERIDEFKSILTTFNESADKMMKIINKSKGYDYGFESMLPAISKIVDILLPYTVVSTELNSANAQGNMSSDVLNNNFISNTLKQIQFGTEKDANAGLQKLLDFVSKSPQYKYSPIFWGVYVNGKQIMPGLFYRDKNGNETVNSNAREMVRVNLFNGISNPLDNAGELYSSMSRADYFMSSLIAFNNTYREQNVNEEQKYSTVRTGNIFLRIPSDAPKNFIATVPIIPTYRLLDGNKINLNHDIVHAFRQVILNELNTFIENLNNIYNIDGTLKTDTNGLFGNYHYKDVIFKDGQLTGNVFNFSKLASYDGFNYNELMQSILSLYTGNKEALIAKNGSLNLNRTDIIRIDGDRFAIAGNNILTNELNSVVEKYLEAAILDANIQTQQYKAIIGEKYDSSSIINTVLNTNLAYTYFDDLFEGDSKFYKNPQTFLKRAKEVQAGGMAYDNWSTNDTIGGDIVNSTDSRGQAIIYEVAGRTYYAKNGFKAVTINNTIRPSDYAKTIEERLLHLDVPAATVKDIVKRFAGDTITNDAQSYITIEELANRLFAKGQLTKYKPLLDKFMAKKEDGSPADVTAEDLKELSGLVEKIQVQKNFYFDKQFDVTTKTVYPRQIKNAEFVLIPQLLGDSSLRTLYDIMIENNIGQVNTAETDKAAKRYVLDFWDKNGKVTKESIDKFKSELSNGNGRAVENYYYRYLYEQQQVAQHMENEQNKAGIQIMKKILDNAGIYSDTVQKNVKTIFDKYVENIEESFNEMLDNMDWKVNEHGQIVNKDGSTELNFKEFYRRGQDEARRLGMDSNFLSYFEFDEKGHAILPNFMNVVQTKLESIAQAMFNSAITRQKLPGFHAAQVTNIGMDNKLGYLADPNNPYAEIRVTPWFPAEVDGKPITLEELIDAEVDYMIGYRIPTEGKQSIAVFRATELLDRTQGSTIVVPDEWVTQTGSDFDVDSVYTITYKFKRDENGKLVKIKEGRDGRNNEILDAMIAIMQDPTVMEENLSCSNFDEIQDNIDYFNSINPQIASSNESVYNMFTQMKYFENATSGMALKAQSVVRDNFDSINSYVRSEMNMREAITVEYDLNNPLYDIDTIKDSFEHVKIDEERNVAIVTHNRLANSKNNRNVVGRLMTVYSSQTTAHILDAIKSGAIFNENLYTFGSFKTLIDLGIDYRTAIAFLQQPAISNIVDNYNKNKSIYSDANSYDTKPIHDAIKDIARIAGIKIHGKEITEFTNIQDVYLALLRDKNLTSAFYELFGADLSFDKKVKHNYIRLNGKMLETRLKQGRISKIGKNQEANDNYTKLAYDLGMTLFFSHIKSVTKGIENIARVSNPDKFGAKQTVSSTRAKIQTIKDIIEEYGTPGFNLLTVDGKDFLQALYPGIINDNIDVKASSYPYLAAFVKYATQPSIDVNSKLFALESDDMVKVYDKIANKIGKNLTEQQQKEFKQYLVSYVYSNVQGFNTPLTIDKQGRVAIDTKIEQENKEENTPEYWNLERNRILGYRVTEDFDIKMNDIYNPTEEEYNKFKHLTPAQKVLFIRKYFHFDSGIFDYLEINEFKGETTIKYKDVTDDIESLYILMNQAFFNTSKIVRLAALDLVKYAYIAEQGKFKKGSISKLITSKILLASKSNYGFNFVDQITNSFDTIVYDEIEQDKVIERFIRSHPYIIDTVNNGRDNKLGKLQNNMFIIDKLDSEKTDFIKYYGADSREYIRIKRYVTDDLGRTITKVQLYKIKAVQENIYLYPISTLNENEVTEYSTNPTNNNIYIPTVFDAIIEAHANGHTDKLDNIKRENIENLKRTKNEVHEKFIADKLNSTSPVEREQAKYIIEHIQDIISSPVKGSVYDGIFPASIYWLYNMTPKLGLKTGSVRQVIPFGDTEYVVGISKYDNTRVRRKLEGKKVKLSPVEEAAIGNIEITGNEKPFLYGVTVIPQSQLNQEAQAVADSSMNEKASTRKFIDNSGNIIEASQIDTIGDSIIRDVIYINRNRMRTQPVADFLKEIKGLNIEMNNLKDVHNNIDEIIQSAANFYTKYGTELLYYATHFRLLDDRVFSINDEELYNNLENENDVDALMSLLLDLQTFGENIKSILLLEPSTENEETNRAIKNIQKIINQVTNNSIVNKAFDNLYNIYFAQKSNNPAIKQQILKLNEAFGDISFLDKTFAAIHELPNSQVQTVVKYIDDRLSKVNRFDAPEAAESIEKAIDKILNESGSFDWDNIITNTGYLVRPYTNEFITKRKELEDKVEQFRNNNDTTSVEYHKAKLELEKFLTKNVNRNIRTSYYERMNALTEQVLNKAPELYSQYTKLIEELNNVNNTVFENINEQILKRKEIQYKISQLTSIYDENLNRKGTEEEAKANALNDFIKKKQNLNKEVFKDVENDEFADKFKYYTNIIEKYDTKHPTKELALKLNDEKYAEAYNWIQTNTITQINEAARDAIYKAFADLKRDAEENPDYVRAILKGKDVYDKNGKIDPNKISLEDARKIKEAKEKQFEKLDYEPAIKNLPANKPKFKQEYWDKIKILSEEEGTEGNVNQDIIKDINKILKKVVKPNEPITWTALDKLSEKELIELGNLYFELNHPPKTGEVSAVAEFIKNNSKKAYNNEAFDTEFAYFVTNLRGKHKKKAKLWLNIFCARNEDGTFAKKNGKLQPNYGIFGYRVPNAAYRDNRKEKAAALLNSNVEWVTTKAYEEAEDRAYLENRYDEWYEANHYYNPYTDQMIPLPYWTEMKIKPNGSLHATYEQVPTSINKHSEVKDEWQNSNYNSEFNLNYNTKTGDYNTSNTISAKEEKMRNLIQNFLIATASNATMRRLASEGFMPRQMRTITNKSWYLKQGLGAIGINLDYNQPEWTYDINPASEREVNAPMMQFLKGKGYKNMPDKKDYIGREADYEAAVEEVKANNLAIDNALMSRDWKTVLANYAQEVTMYNEKQKLAKTAHNLILDLKRNKATKLNWMGNPSVKNKGENTFTEYNTEDYDNLIKVVENWYHRVFREEFKQKSKFNRTAAILQNYTSAKYMIFNVTGGIANVLTGRMNILAEHMAGEYFTHAEFKQATKEYFSHPIDMISNQYSDKANNLTEALIKLGKVVDLDAMLERKEGENLAEYTKRVRDKLYFMQSTGEHIMQNCVFLAMLHSNRVYLDATTGKYKVGTVEQYKADKEEIDFINFIQDKENLTTLYTNFLNRIKADTKLRYEYGTYKRNKIRDFLKAYGDKALQEEFINYHKARSKALESEFAANPDVRSQFELKDGIAVIKNGSLLTKEMFSQLANTAIQVNKRIHGVYDKIGAAYIESFWWGSLVMQYHKHIYPMYKKLWRKNAYYNEARGTIEKGAYQSLWDLTTVGFRDSWESNANIENNIKRSILTAFGGAKACLFDLKFNYNMMSDWERANVRRALASHIAVLSAVMMAIGLHALFDDDDFEEDNFAALCLYQADRLATESFELHPIGLPSAVRTTWSSPIAAQNLPTDLMKVGSILIQGIWDDDFDWNYTTGRYQGQNKILTKIGGNIPIYRIVDRLANMGKSNKFYRLGDTMFDIIPTKKIGNAIQGED